jgi:hypothetical protein
MESLKRVAKQQSFMLRRQLPLTTLEPTLISLSPAFYAQVLNML